MFSLAFVLLFVSGTCSALASFILKSARLPSMDALPFAGPLMWKTGALGFYGIGFLFYAWALKSTPLTTAYPIMVAVTIMEIFLLGYATGERIWYGNVLGAMLIAAGVALIVQ